MSDFDPAFPPSASSADRLPAPSPGRRLRSGRGFSLAEMAVAAAIFLMIALAAFALFSDGNRTYRTGNEAAEMQQRTRLAFDLMLDELRLAGYDYNRDGDENAYPEHPDEQLEYLGAHAITFRANLDFGDGTTGREADYELAADDPDYGTECCPIVTTANEEIVTYALRSADPSANADSITFRADLSMPRDAGWDADGDPQGEEEVTIPGIDLSGSHPPYTLVRFVLDAAGQVVEQPVASDVRSLTFTYASGDGDGFFCTAPASDGSCPTAAQAPFEDLGGDDDLASGDGMGRTGRGAARRIFVELVGMTEHDQPGWTDADDDLMPGRRKLVLSSTVIPPNLGMTGRPDLEDDTAWAPTNVTACVGQCKTIRVEWDDTPRAASYYVKLFLQGQNEPFFVGSTPGIAVVGSSPARVFAVYQQPDAPQITLGQDIVARVQARASGEETSEDSDPSAVVRIVDVTQIEAPGRVFATGYDPNGPYWPLVDPYQPPDMENLSGLAPRVNEIVVSWEAPRWALNVLDSGSPLTSATTQPESGEAPLECDSEWMDVDGDGNNDRMRTRARDQFGTVRYLVFRSTNPRFVPTNGDFVAAISGEVDVEGGRVSYVDQSVHVYSNGIFRTTQNAVENCRTYYYRIRAVDGCWSGSDPASRTDPHLSPFAPALNPDTAAVHTDDVSGLLPEQIGPGAPGFAVPQAPPRAPTMLRFTNYDRRTDDGDGRDATVAFDAVKLDDFYDPSTNQPAFDHVAMSRYELWSSPLTQNFTITDIVNGTQSTRLEKVVEIADVKAGRISYDDENGNGTISQSEDESVPPPSTMTGLPRSGLRVPIDTTTRWYKLVAVQCAAETTYPESDPAAYDYGRLSEAVKFPCDFGGGPYSSVTVDATQFPTRVTSEAVMESLTVAARGAKLVLKDPVNGDRAMSATRVTPTNPSLGTYRVVFDTAHIAQLTDNFGNGTYRVSVEWEDVNGCVLMSDSADTVTALPACCLRPGTPVMSKPTLTRATNTITENCGAASLRIQRIVLSVDNASNGQPERFTSVSWNGTVIWTGNTTNPVIDRTTNPLVLSAYQAGTLQMDFNRAVGGDNVSVRYEYKVGGQTGACTFNQRLP